MQNQKVQNGIIDVPLGVSRIRKLYNFASSFYFLANPLEKKARMRALELAQIKPDVKVLEVAVGPGSTFWKSSRELTFRPGCLKRRGDW